MFGYVTASFSELTKPQKERYGAVYCGICRAIHAQASNLARLGLSYDMAFLALLLMSLYEPEEQQELGRCLLHPVKRRPWVDNAIIRYTADMNVALAYYNCLDDWHDDGKVSAKLLSDALEPHFRAVQARYPRQCRAIQENIDALSALEDAQCQDPDRPAGAFGSLMAELLVWQEDLWAPTLRDMGYALGRFIYLVDAAVDYEKDRKKEKYNPFLASGTGNNPALWEDYLVLAMSRCCEAFEKLPLVQDKALLDNILYSGVWIRYREAHRKEKTT